jgi:hypothetical protein
VYTLPTGTKTLVATDVATLSSLTAVGTITTLIIGTKANPDADDGATLGQSGTGWSDLFLASGAVINHNAGSTTLTGGVNTWTVGGSGANGNQLILAAGGTALGPIKFTSGTNRTTATAGEMEYDGTVHYSAHAASERGVMPSVQHITLTTARTFATGTALQAIFNAPTNGSVTLAGSTTYYFECSFRLTGMSATSGSYALGFGGTASVTRIHWQAFANKGAATPVAALLTVSASVAAVTVVVANTTTTGSCKYWGKVVIGTGGTFIPQMSFSINDASTPIASNDAFFRIWPAGSNTVQSVGNWS